jgi:hypothetical protein
VGESDDALPPSVYRRRGKLYFVATQPGTTKQRWHPLGASWTAEAKQTYLRLVQQNRTSAYVDRMLDCAGRVPLDALRELLRNAKKNAKSRGLDCTLTLDELSTIAERSLGRCELSGIQFSYGVAKEARGQQSRRRRLWAPSIDRLDGRLGYALGNVRLVCFAVNAARQEFGDDVLFRIARALSNIQQSAANSTPAAREENGHDQA